MSGNTRTAVRPVDPLFLDRWSPRAFDGDAMPRSDLDTILDAARWAPSAFNYQPWRFLFAHRDSADWPSFLGLLLPFNAAWAEKASALVFILSDTLIQVPGTSDPSPSHSHSFDTGAAWVILALQATKLGYQAHGLTGIDMDRTRIELAVPERFRIEAAVAIGRQGPLASLSPQLQAREQPSGRRELHEYAYAGRFPS